MNVSLYIPVLVLFVATAAFLVRLMIYQRKLSDYLRVNHTEKWKELTTIWGFGPGYVNSWRAKRFLFSKDDLGDPEVLRLKVIVRNSYIGVMTGIPATFLMALIIVACSEGLKFR